MFGIKWNDVSQEHKLYFGVMFIILGLGTIFIFVQSFNKQKEIDGKFRIKNESSAIDRLEKATDSSNQKTRMLSADPLDNFISQNTQKRKLLFFHSSWDQYSVSMQNDIIKIAETFKKDLAVVIVHVPGSQTKPDDSQSENIKRIVCKDTTIPVKYKIESVPSIVILSEANIVTTTKKGVMTLNDITALINEK